MGIIGLWYVSATRKKNRAGIEAWLREPNAGRLYSEVLGRVLDWVDRRFTPDNVEDTPNPRPDGPWWRNLDWLMTPCAPSRERAAVLGRRAWNWPLFDFALRLAVAYPVMLLVAVWALTGGEGRIGELVVLRAEPPFWMRIATLCGLALFLVQALPENTFGLSSRARSIGFWIALGLMLAGAGAGAVAFAVAVVLAGAFVVAGAVAVAFAVAVAVAGAGAVAVAGAGAVAFAVAVVFAGAVAVAGAGAVAVAVSVAVRRCRGLIGYCALVAGLLGLLFTTAWLGGAENAAVRTVLVFLGVMPLANGVYDFLSIGLTRYLVRLGARSGGWAIPLAAADIVAAGLLFTALGCTLILVIHGLGVVAGTPLVDFGTLFGDLRHPERWRSYWWLYATIFSTLLPTLLHLFVASFSMIAWIRRPLKDRALRLMAEMDDRAEAEWGAIGLLTFMTGLAGLGPPLLIVCACALLLNAYPVIGEGYFDLFIAFAYAIGAV